MGKETVNSSWNFDDQFGNCNEMPNQGLLDKVEGGKEDALCTLCRSRTVRMQDVSPYAVESMPCSQFGRKLA